jgi:hypothetical protein
VRPYKVGDHVRLRQHVRAFPPPIDGVIQRVYYEETTGLYRYRVWWLFRGNFYWHITTNEASMIRKCKCQQDRWNLLIPPSSQ